MHNNIFLNQATLIGRQLYRDAIWHNGRCNWISKEYDLQSGGKSFWFQPMQADFYKGLSGVALFFAALYRQTAKEQFRKTAIGSIQQALLLKTNVPQEYRFSFFRGWTGLAWTLVKVAEFCDAPELKEAAVELIKELMNEPVSNSKIDVIDGLASGIPTLIDLAIQVPALDLASTINNLGQFLIQKAKPTDQGPFWRIHQHQENGTAGFSHGASGISWCLLQLFQYSNDTNYLRMAIAALNYEENVLLDKQENQSNWVKRDWAHGFVGLAMTQWEVYRIKGEDQYLEKAKILTEKAIEAYRNEAWIDFSPCNGIWGLTDLLLLAFEFTNDQTYLSIANELTQNSINQREKNGRMWLNGQIGQEEVPDFMISLSGIGYSLLRLINPNEFPSVLAIRSQIPATAI